MPTKIPASPSPYWSFNTDEFEMYIDESGILRVRVIGFWKIDAVKRYFDALSTMMARARRLTGRALVLLDKRDAAVQAAEVVERLNAGWLVLYEPTDCLAAVVSTSLSKLQTRRVIPADRAMLFESIAVAEDYLLTGGR